MVWYLPGFVSFQGYLLGNFSCHFNPFLDLFQGFIELGFQQCPPGSPHRPIRLTQCCTQFKSPGVKTLCVLYLHHNVAFTFKWYGNSWNKTFYSQGVWIGYNIKLAELVYLLFPRPKPCYKLRIYTVIENCMVGSRKFRGEGRETCQRFRPSYYTENRPYFSYEWKRGWRWPWIWTPGRSMDHLCGPSSWTSTWTRSMDYTRGPPLIYVDEFLPEV